GEHGHAPRHGGRGPQSGRAPVAAVHSPVNQLGSKGWLRKWWNRAPSLEPAGEEGAGQVMLPLLGVAAAGAPIEPIEIEERVAVPAGLGRRPAACVALHVRGDSMIAEHIRDGDTVVAVLRGEEATLKRLRRRGDTMRLIPANARMKPIEVPAREVEIRGVVRALVRRY